MSKFLKNTLARKKVMASSTISVLSAPHHSHGISHILKTQKKKTEQNRTESNGKETLIWNRSRSLNVALERKKRAPTCSTHSIFIHKTRMINLPMHNNNNNNNNNHFQLGINKLTTPPNYEFWISMNWIELNPRTMSIVETIRTRFAQKNSIATPNASGNEGNKKKKKQFRHVNM